MGAYCPVPHIDASVLEQTNKEIAQPIAKAMAQEGHDFFGLLYIGAILTKMDLKLLNLMHVLVILKHKYY